MTDLTEPAVRILAVVETAIRDQLTDGARAEALHGIRQVLAEQPTPDLIRNAIADAVQICNGPLIDHAASGVLYALGMVDIPPADGAPAPAICELPHQTIAEEDDCERRRVAASDDGLRGRYAAAIREATCDGNCGASEEECTRRRIQPAAHHFGKLAEVSGTPEQFADAVMAVRDTELRQARETNRRLNLRCQEAESALATIKRAVGEWEVSERGTYVPLRTIAAIGKAVGRDIDDSRYELHYQRVEAAEATLAAIRAALAGLKADAERYRESGSDALLNTAAGYSGAVARIEAALDGPADTTPEAGQ